ncbi:MAG: gamma-butyrobetaine hydroxylase family protein [Candidatus Eutrophobiaceae bacterium]
MESTPKPIDILLRRKSHVLEIEFDDGQRFSLSFEYLRTHSPSADVRGHGKGQEILQIGKEDVGIDAIEPVGHYAIKLRFNDGHDTGLYSWAYLYALGVNHEENWRCYLAALEEQGHARKPKE